MRRFLALLLLLTLLAAGCTPPPVVTPVASPPAVASAPPVAVSTPVAIATANRGPLPAATAAPSATTRAAPTATLTTAVSTAELAPALTMTIDPPAVPWDGQAAVTVTARDPLGFKEITILLGDQVLARGEGRAVAFDFIPGAIDGLTGAATYTLVARGLDAAGQVAETRADIQVGPQPTDTPLPTPAAAATRRPAATVPPAPTPAPGSQVIGPTERGTTTYRVTQIQLPTYPYQAFLRDTTDGERVDYPVRAFDRSAYLASNPRPQLKSYVLLVLENRYLRLGILPDLGGRIYQCIFKPTGANEFYANPVIKPTEWGPPAPPYAPGAAWWLGAGGLEWGFPVEEHGYEFGTRWGYDHVTQPDGGVMITLFTQGGVEKPVAVVDVILPPDTAYFVVQPRIVNNLGGPFKFAFWENAMLAPGPSNTVSPDLRLSFPAQQVVVHSTGDASLPPAGQRASWPVFNGRDLSRLGAWQSYLGVFAAPPVANFAAAYDPLADEGIVRVFPASVAKGVKLFAPAGLDPALWTDDGSSYVELHGGLTPTFADQYELGPGEEVGWSEFWYPVAKIGGVTFANDRAALSLTPGQDKLRLGLFPTTAVTGRLTVTLPGAGPASFDVQLSPSQPLVRDFPLAAGAQGPVAVTLTVAGETVFDWQGPLSR